MPRSSLPGDHRFVKGYEKTRRLKLSAFKLESSVCMLFALSLKPNGIDPTLIGIVTSLQIGHESQPDVQRMQRSWRWLQRNIINRTQR
jgi:hypothetical protein